MSVLCGGKSCKVMNVQAYVMALQCYISKLGMAVLVVFKS